MENIDNKKNNLVIIMLIVIIAILIIGIVFLCFKYDKLEDKYEDIYNKKYETKYDESNISKDNNSNNQSNNYISNDKALQIVLDNLNISKNDIYDVDIELENKTRYGKTVFEVSFDYNYYEYEYYIDAVNGNILDSFKSRD